MSGNAGAVRFGSVCSGIEAASVAWHPLGWRAAWLAEVDKFPSAVLAHHYPGTPNLGDITAGDFTERAGGHGAIDVLVGGTPCQSFSVAGLRAGLADPRGNLALVFLAIADRLRPAWVVWENVPGVLSSSGGRDFGAFLGALGELGYGWSYRVLDAQYFGVAQRRRRVFVVGYLGDWRRAAAVLFERDCLSGNPPPRRSSGARVAYAVAAGAGGGKFGSGRDGQDTFVTAPTLTGNGDAHSGYRDEPALVAALTSTGVGTCGADDNQAQAGHLVAMMDIHPALAARTGGPASPDWQAHAAVAAFSNRGTDTGASAETLRAGSHGALPMVSYAPPVSGALHTALNTANGNGNDDRVIVARVYQGDRIIDAAAVWPTLPAQSANNGGGAGAILHRRRDMAVRRLTPRECERLQGFPDDYTDVPYRGKPAADGPRYKALGNSMAVPVMRWIGKRIAAVSEVAA